MRFFISGENAAAGSALYAIFSSTSSGKRAVIAGRDRAFFHRIHRFDDCCEAQVPCVGLEPMRIARFAGKHSVRHAVILHRLVSQPKRKPPCSLNPDLNRIDHARGFQTPIADRLRRERNETGSGNTGVIRRSGIRPRFFLILSFRQPLHFIDRDIGDAFGNVSKSCRPSPAFARAAFSGRASKGIPAQCGCTATARARYFRRRARPPSPSSACPRASDLVLEEIIHQNQHALVVRGGRSLSQRLQRHHQRPVIVSSFQDPNQPSSRALPRIPFDVFLGITPFNSSSSSSHASGISPSRSCGCALPSRRLRRRATRIFH